MQNCGRFLRTPPRKCRTVLLFKDLHQYGRKRRKRRRRKRRKEEEEEEEGTTPKKKEKKQEKKKKRKKKKKKEEQEEEEGALGLSGCVSSFLLRFWMFGQT